MGLLNQRKTRLMIIVIMIISLYGCLRNDRQLSTRPTITDFSVSNPTPSEEGTPDGTPTEDQLPEIVRPSNAIFVNRDYCACINRLPDILNNCDAFCSDKVDTSATLYLTTSAGPEVELNSELVDLQGWCTNEIGDGLTAPGCRLEADDGYSKRFIDVNLSGTTLTADISTLSKNATYVMTIVETESGSDARSKEFQIRRVDFDTEPANGLLRIAPIHQYYCVNRAGATDNTSAIPVTEFELAIKWHFYYPDSVDPPTMPPDNILLVCHDINRYGSLDGPLIPRLGLEENFLPMWNQTDPRFYDVDQDSKLDINNQIQDLLLSEYSITSNINLFYEFRWPNYPGASGGDSGLPLLGFLLQPFVDSVTQKAVCPKQSDYNGTDPRFKILKRFIGVDTEGLYMALREPVTFSDGQGSITAGPPDIVFIRESLLKKIWFYFDNGVHIYPDEITSATKQIMIYWPPDVSNPHVKKSTQRIYLVKHPSNISDSSIGDGLRTAIPAPDKRFACIPAVE